MKGWGLSRDLQWLTAAMGLWGLGFGLYGVFWPLYVEKLGGDAIAVGLLSTLAGVVTALVVFPGGFLSDRVDRKTLIWWGWIIAVPVPFMFAWAPTWQWLIPGVVLYFGSAFSTPALQAVVVQEASGPQLATAYNIVLSVFGAGMVLGPSIGGFLASHFSYRLVFVLSGAIYLLSSLCVLPIRSYPPAASRPRFDWSLRGHPRLVQWVMFSGGLAVIQGLAWPFVVPYLRSVGHLSVENIGVAGSVGVLAATVAGPLWGKVGDRLGIPQSLGYGLGLVTLGWLALLWNPAEMGWVLFSGVLRGGGEGARGLAGVAIGRTVRMAEAGTAYGVLNLVTELAGALAPLPGGVLYSRWPFAPIVVTTLLTGIVAWWLIEGLPGRPAPTPPLQL